MEVMKKVMDLLRTGHHWHCYMSFPWVTASSKIDKLFLGSSHPMQGQRFPLLFFIFTLFKNWVMSICSSESKMFQRSEFLYRCFNDSNTPWSIGYSNNVTFGGRNVAVTAPSLDSSRSFSSRWAEQLSKKTNDFVSCPSDCNLVWTNGTKSSWNQDENMLVFIQALFWLLYTTGRFFMLVFLKRQGWAASYAIKVEAWCCLLHWNMHRVLHALHFSFPLLIFRKD